MTVFYTNSVKFEKGLQKVIQKLNQIQFLLDIFLNRIVKVESDFVCE